MTGDSQTPFSDGETDLIVLYGGTTFQTHGPAQCAGNPCPIHNPSDHMMRDWPITIRPDRHLLVERVCTHGCGHPDPDSLAWLRSTGINDQGVHGCCGCCIPPGQRPHAVTAACREEHCTYHQVDEPAWGAYRVCVERGHAFATENELRAAFAAAPPGDGPAPPGDQIAFCPLCAHDF